MKHIVLTGGGTAGHVTPNIALIPKLRELGYKISYIGSYEGIEKKLIEELGIPYYGISSGKLRRYFDLKNFSDPFRVLKGFSQARKILKELKPDVVFSKGGFVTVPVVIAAKRLKIPALIHESDMTPGLANKLCIRCRKSYNLNSVSLLHPESAVIFLRQSPIFQLTKQFLQELRSARNFFPEMRKTVVNSVVSLLTNRYLWLSVVVWELLLSMIMSARSSLNF